MTGRLQIVGADEYLVGYDDDDYYDDEVEALLGQRSLRPALRRRIAPRRSRVVSHRGGLVDRAKAVATAVKAVDAGTIVREAEPTKSQRLVFGMTSLAVAAGANVIVTVNPQVLFRPERITIPASIAPSFVINDIIVGNKSQLALAGAVPAEAFTQTADASPDMAMDTVGISMDFVLSVTNISAAPADFRAAVYGRAVQ